MLICEHLVSTSNTFVCIECYSHGQDTKVSRNQTQFIYIIVEYVMGYSLYVTSMCYFEPIVTVNMLINALNVSSISDIFISYRGLSRHLVRVP